MLIKSCCHDWLTKLITEKKAEYVRDGRHVKVFEKFTMLLEHSIMVDFAAAFEWRSEGIQETAVSLGARQERCNWHSLGGKPLLLPRYQPSAINWLSNVSQ
jgi:hypothetical protein